MIALGIILVKNFFRDDRHSTSYMTSGSQKMAVVGRAMKLSAITKTYNDWFSTYNLRAKLVKAVSKVFISVLAF